MIKLMRFTALLALLAASACQAAASPTAQAEATPQAIQDLSGFARADGPTQMEFPADYGAHPEYRTEWWYYTGNLDTAEGRHFGFELTFFRVALLPAEQTAPRSSDWATNQIYMGHLALTDVAGNQFYAIQRYSRGAAGLAGAQADPYRVWLEDWQVEQTGQSAYSLHAADEGFALDLQLMDATGPVLHGDGGYSQKGPEAGNASYYYSLPRLETSGQITVGDETYAVSGLSWKDHEYSTSVLSEGQVGWDWFAIQLDDGSSLMLYQLRRDDGSIDPFSSGTLIAADGTPTPLEREDFTIEVLGEWHSPHSGGDYPMGWAVSVPSAELEIELDPYLKDQELNLSTIYWEGAVGISGSRGDQAIAGHGYVELTGYARPFNGDF